MDQIQNSRNELGQTVITVSNSSWDNPILILLYSLQTTLTPPGYQWRQMRSFTRMELSSPRLAITAVFLSFIVVSCHPFVDALLEQRFFQDTWRLIPRVEKPVSLQFAFGLVGGCWFSLAVVQQSEWSPPSVRVSDIHRLLVHIDFIWLANIETSMLSEWDLGSKGVEVPLP